MNYKNIQKVEAEQVLKRNDHFGIQNWITGENRIYDDDPKLLD